MYKLYTTSGVLTSLRCFPPLSTSDEGEARLHVLHCFTSSGMQRQIRNVAAAATSEMRSNSQRYNDINPLKSSVELRQHADIISAFDRFDELRVVASLSLDRAFTGRTLADICSKLIHFPLMNILLWRVAFVYAP